MPDPLFWVVIPGMHRCTVEGNAGIRTLLTERFKLPDRRSAQTTSAGGDEKEAVKSYFNSVGFERWNKIYGTTDEISSVSPIHSGA